MALSDPFLFYFQFLQFSRELLIITITTWRSSIDMKLVTSHNLDQQFNKVNEEV